MIKRHGLASTSNGLNRISKGISLVEICVVIAITTLLALTACPWLLQPSAGQLQRVSHTLEAHLHLARHEAIKSGHRAVVCKSEDGRTCSTKGSWSSGWIVFRDINNNSERDDEEIVIQVANALPAQWVLSGNLSVNRYVSFQPDGSPALMTGALQAGTFSLCTPNSHGGQMHQIVMSATGRVRIQAGSQGKCA